MNEESITSSSNKKSPSYRVAFKMQLFAGKKEEYKKRHDEIWPELVALLFF
jgi:type IV secretory pathway component VirB8